jgi:hypothetical protein
MATQPSSIFFCTQIVQIIGQLSQIFVSHIHRTVSRLLLSGVLWLPRAHNQPSRILSWDQGANVANWQHWTQRFCVYWFLLLLIFNISLLVSAGVLSCWLRFNILLLLLKSYQLGVAQERLLLKVLQCQSIHVIQVVEAKDAIHILDPRESTKIAQVAKAVDAS